MRQIAHPMRPMNMSGIFHNLFDGTPRPTLICGNPAKFKICDALENVRLAATLPSAEVTATSSASPDLTELRSQRKA
ncbi:hypothetical protein QUA81_24385 [Microcoleus sp. F6_B4]